MLPVGEVRIYNCLEQKAFLENAIQNEPPYKELQFDLGWYSDFVNVHEIAISSFCNNCGSERVFKADINPKTHNLFARDVVLHVPVPAGMKPADSQEFFSRASYSVLLELKCAMCGEIHYYSLLFKGDKLIKIGQYPSYSSNEAQCIRKYKNLISKYYPELTKSVNAFSQGMGVAAFVYLRRILEHLIEKRFTGDKTWKFEEKLHEVEKTEKIIPDELQTVKNQIYAILSKGVHEYEEGECLALYPAVRYVIERMLDLELEKKERDKKAKQAIAAISGKLQG